MVPWSQIHALSDILNFTKGFIILGFKSLGSLRISLGGITPSIGPDTQ